MTDRVVPLSSLIQKIAEAASNPQAALAYLTRKSVTSHLTGLPVRSLDVFYREFGTQSEIIQGAKRANWPIGWTEDLYVLIRGIRPEIVVETGIGHGISSAAILAALDYNQLGQLFSVDAPNLDPLVMLPAEKEPGWIVPSKLRNRWHLRLGLSREILPALLDELGTIDLFIHDSEHSYENMMFEYRTAYTHLRLNGLLISDDTTWNKAFEEFVAEVGANPPSMIRHPNVKVLRKARN